MDPHEQSLIAAYNAALSRLKKIPKGDPRHGPASRELIRSIRALKRYRRACMN